MTTQIELLREEIEDRIANAIGYLQSLKDFIPSFKTVDSLDFVSREITLVGAQVKYVIGAADNKASYWEAHVRPNDKDDEQRLTRDFDTNEEAVDWINNNLHSYYPQKEILWVNDWQCLYRFKNGNIMNGYVMKRYREIENTIRYSTITIKTGKV